MGNQVGVLSEQDLQGLDPDARAQLKEAALEQLLTSPEIQAIIRDDPSILTSNPEIRKILKDKISALQARLKK